MAAITVTIDIDNAEDHDPTDNTGLVVEAYERLVAAINGAGFSVSDVEVC